MLNKLSKDFPKELFEDELKVLESAITNITDDKYKDNELLPKYRELAEYYNKLLNLTCKAFKISDMQGVDLKRRESEIKSLLDNSNQGFLTFGEDLLVDREYSSECTRIFGRGVAGVCILELLSGFNDEQNKLFSEVFENIFKIDDMDTRYSYISKLSNIVKINDRYVSIKYRIISRFDYELENDIMMLVLTDITEKQKAEDQVLYLSFHDKLTSLYNRAYIDSIISQVQAAHNLPISVIMADMNGLKLTNDVFGHESGDKLLISLSKVLLRCCRRSDIVARWGGDEFLIILPGADSGTCEKVCERIKKMCSKTEPNPVELSVSIGFATTESLDAKVYELFSIAEDRMYSNKVVESRNVRKKIIMSMERILHTKCFESYEHVERLKRIGLGFAACLELHPDSIEMANLPLLATLHDIGKVTVPENILGKKGPLNDGERKIMQSHTEVGFRMAQSIEEPVLAQAILSLREHWDGGGYPQGLKGEQIPLISRIISIVDAYDVMTHDQPYKNKITRDQALHELERCSGCQFDPNLVKVFLNNIDRITG